MTVAPIALFVYNRPWHTRQTIEALQKNALAAESDLFIFSDAAKTVEKSKDVSEVRSYISGIEGFKSVTIVERKKNLGLAASIIDGVTRLCNEYGRVIVLEDDLVTSPYFLQFMNEALDVYSDTKQVMHISGSIYPIRDLDENFFFRVPLCWGWATWDHAWQYFDKNIKVMSNFNSKMRRAFNINNSYHYWEQLEGNKKGLIDTWFVFWYANIFLRQGLAYFPSHSLVLNIGFDGSGVHCGESQDYEVPLSKKPIEVKKVEAVELSYVVEQHYIYFRKISSMPDPSLAGLPVRAYGYLIRKIESIFSYLQACLHA